MTNEKIAELKQAANYANAHGNGVVTVKADDLLEILPAPVEPVAEHGDVIAEAAAVPVETHTQTQTETPAEPQGEAAGETGAPAEPKEPTIQ